MRILVINEPFMPGFCRTQRWAARTRARVMRPPDWMAYITAVLENAGHDVRLYDFPARDWERSKFVQVIEKHHPDAVILDSTTPSIYSDLSYAALCKQLGVRWVVMVGPHASALPEETLLEGKGAVDFIVRGEPENTMMALFEALSSHADPESVRGVSFLIDGAVTHTEDRPREQNLDRFPFPAWHHLRITDYFDGIKLYPFVDIIGGRGCPYQCSFCLWPQVMHGNRYRLRSAGNIVSEIIYDLHVWPSLRRGEFFFEDDTFTVDRDRAVDICEEITHLPVPITWSVNVRADHGDDELFRTMKRSGCRMLLIGYESADKTVLDLAGKKLNPEKALQMARCAKRAGLKIHGCFVLGLPGETAQSMEDTIRYALELNLDTVQFSAAVPFPGTRYFDYCQKHDLLRAKTWQEWLSEGEQTCVVDYPDLSCKEVTSRVDEALRRFYFRPSYMATFLLSTRSFSDLYRKTRGAGNFLSYLAGRMKG